MIGWRASGSLGLYLQTMIDIKQGHFVNNHYFRVHIVKNGTFTLVFSDKNGKNDL
jgi:hypothetical protein